MSSPVTIRFPALLPLLILVALVSPSVTLAEDHCDFADEMIMIGGVLPLSSPGSVTGGIGMDWGFQQAAADINADCGTAIGEANHRVKVITADSVMQYTEEAQSGLEAAVVYPERYRTQGASYFKPGG